MTDVPVILLQAGPHGPHGPHGPMGPNGGAGWGTMPWGTAGGGAWLLPALLWLLVLLAVVAGLVYLAWRLVLADESSADPPDAMCVLETRYARGEVDDEEFERRRDRLGAEP